MNPAKQQEIMAYAVLMGYTIRCRKRIGYTNWWAYPPKQTIDEWATNRRYVNSLLTTPQSLDALLDKIGMHHGLL